MSNKQIRVYICGGMQYREYVNWLPNCTIVNNMKDANLVFFAGGEDVSPSLYGQVRNSHTYCDVRRDERELYDFSVAQGLGLPCLCVCRGSQFICVMAGGSLVQDQTHQSYLHGMYLCEKGYQGDFNEEDMKMLKSQPQIMVTSSHHQAQYPFDMPKEDYELLGYTINLSKYHVNGAGQELNPPVEVEMCYYPKINALAIQSHPECVFGSYGKDKEVNNYIDACRRLVNSRLFGQQNDDKVPVADNIADKWKGWYEHHMKNLKNVEKEVEF